jgi:uncharacterized MAPEG superfamily protein
MTIELWILASSIVLGLVQIVASSHAASLQRGYRWAASERDGEAAPLVGVAARLERALRNFGETFPLFASAVIVAHLAGKHGRLTVAGAEMYLGGRIVYVVLYGLGVPLVRSLIWNVATIGIVLILAALV